MMLSMNHSPLGDMDFGFATFAQMVQDTIGVSIPPSKRKMIENRLGNRVRELGLRDVQDYFRHLFEGDTLGSEMGYIEEVVTTNKTDFFREIDHFHYLRDEVLKNHARRGTQGMFKAWSAAASTGAESYSMAMLLAEHALAYPGFGWGVLGTDISTRVLDHARRGIYSSSVIEPVPAALRSRYLHEGQNEWRGKWRISPTLRNRVHFRRLNLMNADYNVDTNLDVIFLRNVLIYFDPEVQVTVLHRIGRHLAPGGHLFVGHSEGMVVRMPHFRQVAPSVYRKDA